MLLLATHRPIVVTAQKPDFGNAVLWWEQRRSLGSTTEEGGTMRSLYALAIFGLVVSQSVVGTAVSASSAAHVRIERFGSAHHQVARRSQNADRVLRFWPSYAGYAEPADSHPLLDLIQHQVRGAAAGSSPSMVTVWINGIGDMETLRALHVPVLSVHAGTAVVIPDEAQLQHLAIDRMFPQQQVLVSQFGSQASIWSRASLTTGAITPLMRRSLTVQRLLALYSPIGRAQKVPPAEAKAWCLTPNTDHSSDPRYTDYQLIHNIYDWLAHRTMQRLTNHPPFNGWGVLNRNGCTDDDAGTTPPSGDGIPDAVEENYIGTSPTLMSTSSDAYADGQKVFGSAPSNLPAGYVGGRLPGYVKPPYDSPYVAALPAPSVTITGPIHVQEVSQIYSGNTQSNVSEKNYSYAQTQETSQSIANTKTWNNWQETSKAVSMPYNATTASRHPIRSLIASRLTMRRAAAGTICQNFGTLVINWGSLCSQYLSLQGNINADTQTCSVTDGSSASLGFTGDVPSGQVGVQQSGTCDVASLDRVQEDYCNAGVLGGVLDLGATLQGCLLEQEGGVAARPAACASAPSQSKQPVGCPNENTYRTGTAGGLYGMGQTSAQAALDAREGLSGNSNTLNGFQLAIDNESRVIGQGLFNVANAISEPRITTTNTNGQSWGGSQTVTTEQSQSNTVTNGYAFFTGQEWTNATTTSTKDAAELSFSYNICNNGDDVMPALKDLYFNVYVNNDPNPIVTDYNVGPTTNLYPAGSSSGQPCSGSVKVPAQDLTLDQLKEIDENGNVRVVVGGFDYATENTTVSATDNGITVLIDDGTDGMLHQYILPVQTEESLQQLLESFLCPGVPLNSSQAPACNFDKSGRIDQMSAPSYDANGNLIGWTPHPTSDTAWWRIDFVRTPGAICKGCHKDATGKTQLPSNIQLQDISVPANLNNQGWEIVIRFDQDSDHDGYSDRTERQMSIDAGHPECAVDPNASSCPFQPNNPNSHPSPIITAGYTQEPAGTSAGAAPTCSSPPCTERVQLSLQNTGSFEAYGTYAAMYSPDSTTTVKRNTVGTDGVVPPGQQIAVGGLIDQPDVSLWTPNSVQPFAGGSYEGDNNATYTFTVANPGAIGQGNTSMTWSCNGCASPNTGALDLSSDSNYQTPELLPVANGLEIGFGATSSAGGHSGDLTLNADTSFTVTAFAPQDNFSYTINRTPYTPPVIVVGYSDPQGFHQFVTHLQMTSLSDSLSSDGPQMLRGEGMKLDATGSFAAGQNTTNVELDNADSSTIRGAVLHLDFASNGHVVYSWKKSYNVASGPTIYPVTWSTASFSKWYKANLDDDVMVATWTDAHGDIIDRTARPFSTFAADPRPSIHVSASPWNLGSLTQGERAQHSISIVNTGLDPLHFSVRSADSNISFTGNAGTPMSNGIYTVSPSFTFTLNATLDSANEPSGNLKTGITLESNDSAIPRLRVPLSGTIISSGAAQASSFDVPNQPWTKLVRVYGSMSQGTPVTFADGIQGDDGTAQPCFVFRMDGSRAGVGQACSDFGTGGTGSSDLFGNGQDLSQEISSDTQTPNCASGGPNGTNCDLDTVRALAAGTKGQTTLNVGYVTGNGFAPGQLIMIHQSQGVGAGQWELNHVTAVNTTSPGSDTLTLAKPLQNTYTSDEGAAQNPGNDTAQALWVPQYANLSIDSGVTVAPRPWDGSYGGIEAVAVSGTLTNNGTISADGLTQTDTSYNHPSISNGGGFRGGSTIGNDQSGFQGEGTVGPGSQGASGSNGNGGGAGTYGTYQPQHARSEAGGGGGGSNDQGATAGQDSPDGISGGQAGQVEGSADLSDMVFGGGGGGGAGVDNRQGGLGGNGGGIIVILGANVLNKGTFSADGAEGQGTDKFPVGAAGGGGGAGGSVLVEAGRVSFGNSQVTAIGGLGGPAAGGEQSGDGGVGGNGRIAVSSCSPPTGATNPAYGAAISIPCYVASETSPPSVQFTVPDNFTNGQDYAMQFAHVLPITGAGMQTTIARVSTQQQYSTATMDAYVTGVQNSAPDVVSIDVGKTGSPQCQWSGTINTSAQIVGGSGSSCDFANAFNSYVKSYLVSHPTATYVDVPIRVSSSPNASHSLSFNAILSDLTLTPGAGVDLAIKKSGLKVGCPGASTCPVTEGQTIPIHVTFSNRGMEDASSIDVGFFAGNATAGVTMLGNAYVDSLKRGASATIPFTWNTAGFNGKLRLYAILNPSGAISETSMNNNSASMAIKITKK
jgi:hypothetical protein